MKTACPATATLFVPTFACTRYESEINRQSIRAADPAGRHCNIFEVDDKRLWTDDAAQTDNCAIQRFVINSFLRLVRPAISVWPIP